MNKSYLIGNWKMYPSEPKQARDLLQKIESKINKDSVSNLEVVICPPAPWLALFNKSSADYPFSFGAQAGFYKDEGAYTGEVSISMLKNLNARYLLVGHSETRQSKKLANKRIKKTLTSATDKDITPIYFVGEKEKQNRKETLKEQLQPLTGLREEKFLLVYEPLWAISKSEDSRPAEPREVKQALEFIKTNLKENKIKPPPFLYGGSTSEANIKKFISLKSLSGVVPGSASRDPQAFAKMVDIASSY